MKYEKEMIPVLNDFLLFECGYSKVLNEFNLGYGIADIVAIEIKEKDIKYPFLNLLEVYLLNDIPMNRWLDLYEIMDLTAYSKKYLKYNVLNKYVDTGYLLRRNDSYKRVKKLPRTRNTIIAIEAKLKRWKDSLMQALRYKKYADYCYVALPENTIEKIKSDPFIENNIGIISLSKNKKASIFLPANTNKEKDYLYSICANSLLTRA